MVRLGRRGGPGKTQPPRRRRDRVATLTVPSCPRLSAQEETSVSSSSPDERTLVLIKPDAVRRGLVGEILSRFERKGLRIDAMVSRTMDGDFADQHYAEHVDKPFYPPLKTFMTSGPLVALVLSGDQVIEVVRAMIGSTEITLVLIERMKVWLTARLACSA